MRPVGLGQDPINESSWVLRFVSASLLTPRGESSSGGDSGGGGNPGGNSDSGGSSNSGGNPPAGSGGTPPAGTPPVGGSGSNSDDDDDDDKKTYDAVYVKQLRQENAQRRKENKELATRLKALEDAQLTEEQKRAKELEDLRKTNAELSKKARLADLQSVAARAGARHPEVVARMVDDDAEDIEKAVAKIKKDYADLFKPAGPSGGGNGGAGNSNTGGDNKTPHQNANDVLRRLAGRIVD